MSDPELLVELPDEQVRAVARLVHEQFRANELAEGRLDAEKPSHQEWDQLTEDIRSRNYAQVRAYPAYLALAGLAIVPAGDHVEADTTYALVLDFDAAASIKETGAGYLLTPVLSVKSFEPVPEAADAGVGGAGGAGGAGG